MGCLLILVDGLKPNCPAYIQILWHLRVAFCIQPFNGANGQPGNQSVDKGKEASVEEVLQATLLIHQHGDALTPFFNPEDGPSTHKSTRPGTSYKVPMDHLARNRF
ncbi:uncharacterized protein LOC112205572 isoform X3 [Pan troglodytes]|uniref:uncharacterized protein LOC112205572 isoform X3 n=1 Tax=Pan troglodytes TaxID=9598 RepID=UPI003013A8D6